MVKMLQILLDVVVVVTKSQKMAKYCKSHGLHPFTSLHIPSHPWILVTFPGCSVTRFTPWAEHLSPRTEMVSVADFFLNIS
jgi:hypothetical protein